MRRKVIFCVFVSAVLIVVPFTTVKYFLGIASLQQVRDDRIFVFLFCALFHIILTKFSLMCHVYEHNFHNCFCFYMLCHQYFLNSFHHWHSIIIYSAEFLSFAMYAFSPYLFLFHQWTYLFEVIRRSSHSKAYSATFFSISDFSIALLLTIRFS